MFEKERKMFVGQKKWWEVASSALEIELFKMLCRSEKYTWRSYSSIVKHLAIEYDEFENLIEPYIRNKMLFIKTTESNTYVGYWENIGLEYDIHDSEEEDSSANYDPNTI